MPGLLGVGNWVMDAVNSLPWNAMWSAKKRSAPATGPVEGKAGNETFGLRRDKT